MVAADPTTPNALRLVSSHDWDRSLSIPRCLRCRTPMEGIINMIGECPGWDYVHQSAIELRIEEAHREGLRESARAIRRRMERPIPSQARHTWKSGMSSAAGLIERMLRG